MVLTRSELEIMDVPEILRFALDEILIIQLQIPYESGHRNILAVSSIRPSIPW